jgi:hypothetical protein
LAYGSVNISVFKPLLLNTLAESTCFPIAGG